MAPGTMEVIEEEVDMTVTGGIRRARVLSHLAAHISITCGMSGTVPPNIHVDGCHLSPRCLSPWQGGQGAWGRSTDKHPGKEQGTLISNGAGAGNSI